MILELLQKLISMVVQFCSLRSKANQSREISGAPGFHLENVSGHLKRIVDKICLLNIHVWDVNILEISLGNPVSPKEISICFSQLKCTGYISLKLLEILIFGVFCSISKIQHLSRG